MKIKGFDENLCCRGMQFEVGKEYKIELDGRKMALCSDTVFHYCDCLRNVHEHYRADNDKNRFCEIEVLGEEVTDGKKFGSNHIRILREITGEELNRLKCIVNGNTGIFNTGNWNAGDRNTGNWNTGNWNAGDRNTGNWNTGNWNAGNRNSGDWNAGDRNSGNCNAGDRNTGNWNAGNWNAGNRNSGDWNAGDRNSGDWNSGDWNSGDWNAGDWNTGNWNTGNWNTGNWNTGNWNTGNWNTGNRNSGVFNACNYSNGVFCNKEDENIRIFNKPSGISLREFYASKYWNAMCSSNFVLTEWVEYSKEEKQEDEQKALIGGYLKKNTYKEACARWWDDMTEENREIIKSMPNFDKEVFKDITGIEV